MAKRNVKKKHIKPRKKPLHKAKGKQESREKSGADTRSPKISAAAVRGKLEAVLLLLKMSREVGLYHIESHDDGLRLNVNRGDLFAGDNLASYIADLSEGAITADKIKVRQ
jgi:hypothetical protein